MLPLAKAGVFLRAVALIAASFCDRGVGCSAKFVLYIAFSPFSPQNVILREPEGRVEIFVVEA
jgi:hypothetical protein